MDLPSTNTILLSGARTRHLDDCRADGFCDAKLWAGHAGALALDLWRIDRGREAYTRVWKPRRKQINSPENAAEHDMTNGSHCRAPVRHGPVHDQIKNSTTNTRDGRHSRSHVLLPFPGRRGRLDPSWTQTPHMGFAGLNTGWTADPRFCLENWTEKHRLPLAITALSGLQNRGLGVRVPPLLPLPGLKIRWAVSGVGGFRGSRRVRPDTRSLDAVRRRQ
jgi:hypothetical protein